jgi:hypothetical protein
VIIYMMDVSGSMGDEQKELVRLEAFWIDTWLRRNYEGIESRYIVHDVHAQARSTARRSSAPARTAARKISSPSSLPRDARGTLRPERLEHLPVPLLRRRQLVRGGQRASVREAAAMSTCCRSQTMFGYCQVASAYGSGNFINVLREQLSDSAENMVTSRA